MQRANCPLLIDPRDRSLASVSVLLDGHEIKPIVHDWHYGVTFPATLLDGIIYVSSEPSLSCVTGLYHWYVLAQYSPGRRFHLYRVSFPDLDPIQETLREFLSMVPFTWGRGRTVEITQH